MAITLQVVLGRSPEARAEGAQPDVGSSAFQLTQIHRTLLGKMVVVWNPTESGAPTVDPAAPYGSSNPWKDVESVARRLGPRLARSEARRLHRETLLALRILLEFGDLDPGRYTQPDPLGGRTPPFAGISLIDAAESAVSAEIEIRPAHRRELNLQFDFTEHHRRLLRAMTPEWYEWSEEGRGWTDGPQIDPKRPYGNSPFIFSDMALALGLEPAGRPARGAHGFSDEQLRAMGRLHHEMDAALQVFLLRATVPLRAYTFDEDGYLSEQRP